MRKLFFIGFILFPFMSEAQSWHLNVFGGTTNYQGDLQSQRFTMAQSHLAGGLGITRDINPHISVSAKLLLGKISADDKKSSQTDLLARNLNFSSGLTEFSATVAYQLFDLEEKSWTPYVFAGLALFHFNPYTKDTLGSKYFLKPLSTEGQGLTGTNSNNYALTQFALPFGGGLKWRIHENMVIGYEIGLRKTFTDYLDDVSTTYIDGTTLLNAKGPKAVELAYRGGEVKNGNAIYPIEGTTRGNPATKDWYYFQGITLSYRLGNVSNGFKGFGGNKGRTGCPNGVL